MREANLEDLVGVFKLLQEHVDDLPLALSFRDETVQKTVCNAFAGKDSELFIDEANDELIGAIGIAAAGIPFDAELVVASVWFLVSKDVVTKQKLLGKAVSWARGKGLTKLVLLSDDAGDDFVCRGKVFVKELGKHNGTSNADSPAVG